MSKVFQSCASGAWYTSKINTSRPLPALSNHSSCSMLIIVYVGRTWVIMDAPLEAERQMIITEVRRFVDREVIPVAHELEHSDTYPFDLVEKLKKLGVFSATIPEAYGGLGFDFATYIQVVEELSRGWMSLAGIVNTHVLVAYMITAHGTGEQRQRFLPLMAEGDKRGGLCISEANAGSDVQAISMTAVRDGENYVLNGSKLWVTNGVHASIFAVLARTDSSAHPPYRGMSVFLVEKGTPGLSASRTFEKLADKATKIEAARLLLQKAAQKKDRGERCDLEAGMAKLFASEMCQEVTLEALRIHGGFGYTKEFNVERYYRDAPFMLVGEGTSEIQRLVIARQLLERYKL